MKTSQTILNTLTGHATFRPLSAHRCYGQFLGMLPPRFREAIGFVYVRNRTLHVALRHPGYKMELNYNQELLKSLLATLGEHQPECAHLRADRVVLFVSRYASSSVTGTDNEESVPYYTELAEGTFVNRTETPELHEQFEQLRRTILSHRGHDA